jgi:SAM-dependent methyltransferase
MPGSAGEAGIGSLARSRRITRGLGHQRAFLTSRYVLPVTDVTQDAPSPFDTGHPNIARVYDYLLGGHDNYAADRALAEELLSQQPALRANAQANRAFMQRVVRTLASAGIDQFLDVGTGLPTGENVHQVAQSINPRAHVVYVDNDEVVAAHARALLASDYGVEFVRADLRAPAEIIAAAQDLLDFSRPVAVLAVSMLHFIPDDDQAIAIVAALTGSLASGSYLVISHWAYRPSNEELARKYSGSVHAIARRTQEEIAALLPTDWESIEPGLVPVSTWRPAANNQADPATIQFMGAVIRKP